jgi:hypothetical protein
MRVYQNLGINYPEEAGFPIGTVGLPFVVESAQIIKGGFRDRNVLQMSLREKEKKRGLSCGYGLIGEEVYEPFMIDSDVEKADSLVGKTVLAFIAPRNVTIQGLTIRK